MWYPVFCTIHIIQTCFWRSVAHVCLKMINSCYYKFRTQIKQRFLSKCKRFLIEIFHLPMNNKENHIFLYNNNTSNAPFVSLLSRGCLFDTDYSKLVKRYRKYTNNVNDYVGHDCLISSECNYIYIRFIVFFVLSCCYVI